MGLGAERGRETRQRGRRGWERTEGEEEVGERGNQHLGRACATSAGLDMSNPGREKSSRWKHSPRAENGSNILHVNILLPALRLCKRPTLPGPPPMCFFL